MIGLGALTVLLFGFVDGRNPVPRDDDSLDIARSRHVFSSRIYDFFLGGGGQPWYKVRVIFFSIHMELTVITDLYSPCRSIEEMSTSGRPLLSFCLPPRVR